MRVSCCEKQLIACFHRETKNTSAFLFGILIWRRVSSQPLQQTCLPKACLADIWFGSLGCFPLTWVPNPLGLRLRRFEIGRTPWLLLNFEFSVCCCVVVGFPMVSIGVPSFAFWLPLAWLRSANFGRCQADAFLRVQPGVRGQQCAVSWPGVFTQV